MLNFDSNIFKGNAKKKRSTSTKVENRAELFRHILSQPEINLHQLEELCFEGIPEDNEIKATCWKILLGYLPLKTAEWKSHLQKQRNLYEFYINLLFQNPETYNNGQLIENHTSIHLAQSHSSDHHHTNTENDTNNMNDDEAPNAPKIIRSQTIQTDTASFTTHRSKFSDFATKNAYFQEDECKEEKARTFFIDSDEERKPKPGLFDSDDDNNDKHVQNNEYKAKAIEIKTTDIHPKISIQHIDEELEHKIEQREALLSNHTSNRSNTSNGDEIVFMTPSGSKRESSSFNKAIDDPILSDLVPETNDDPLYLLPATNRKELKENKSAPIHFETPKIFEEHEDDDIIESKILINGQKIKKIKPAKVRELEFKASTAPDPLSQTPNNPWKTYFDDWEIWNRIKKDIHRTHQTYAFFRSNHMICEDSMSKKYRFPFDISTNPTIVTRSASSAAAFNKGKDNIKNKKRISLKNIVSDEEIVSDIDIESIEDDDLKHNRSKMDPNKKARIERYVLDSKQQGIHAQVMIRILCVYARLNKGVEYVQGMNELLAPIYYIFNMDASVNRAYAEADSFFCFMNLMSYLADRFIAESDNSQLGIIAVVNEFDELLQFADYELWSLLREQDLDAKFYALRWLMLLMAMEFQLPEVLRLWDSFLSDHNRFEFVTYFAIAMLHKVKNELMNGNFAENLQLLQKYPSFDLYELLLPAMDFREKYPMKDIGTIARKENKKKGKKKNKGAHRKMNSVNFIKSVKSKSQNSAKDIFGNMLRPQSTRVSRSRNRNSTNMSSAYNIFNRSKSPKASSPKNANTRHQRSFSLANWKKKWSTKQ